MEKKHIVHKNDNVYIDLDNGHKYALRDIKNGENIIKYGFPIGHATEDIAEGEHVHSHNVKTNLSDISEYSYKFIGTLVEKVASVWLRVTVPMVSSNWAFTG